MMLRVLGIALTVAAVGFLLGEMGSGTKKLFGTVCAVICVSGLLPTVSDIVTEALGIAEICAVTDIAACASRIIGVGYVFSFGADVCEQLSEKACAGLVLFAGRLEILVIIFPYFKDIIKIGTELLT